MPELQRGNANDASCMLFLRVLVVERSLMGVRF